MNATETATTAETTLVATHTMWDEDVARDPAQDYTGRDGKAREAWRFTTPCGGDCHHPAHAFGTARGARHLEWFTPGAAPVNPTPAPPLPVTDDVDRDPKDTSAS